MRLYSGFASAAKYTNSYVRVKYSKIGLLIHSRQMLDAKRRGFPLILYPRNFSSYLRHAIVISENGSFEGFWVGS